MKDAKAGLGLGPEKGDETRWKNIWTGVCKAAFKDEAAFDDV